MQYNRFRIEVGSESKDYFWVEGKGEDSYRLSFSSGNHYPLVITGLTKRQLIKLAYQIQKAMLSKGIAEIYGQEVETADNGTLLESPFDS